MTADQVFRRIERLSFRRRESNKELGYSFHFICRGELEQLDKIPSNREDERPYFHKFCNRVQNPPSLRVTMFIWSLLKKPLSPFSFSLKVKGTEASSTSLTIKLLCLSKAKAC